MPCKLSIRNWGAAVKMLAYSCWQSLIEGQWMMDTCLNTCLGVTLDEPSHCLYDRTLLTFLITCFCISEISMKYLWRFLPRSYYILNTFTLCYKHSIDIVSFQNPWVCQDLSESLHGTVDDKCIQLHANLPKYSIRPLTVKDQLSAVFSQQAKILWGNASVFISLNVIMVTTGISNNSTAAEQTIRSAVIRHYADVQTCLPCGWRFSSSFQCPFDIAFIGVPFTAVLVNLHTFRHDNIITTSFNTGFIDFIDSLFENLGRVTWVAVIDFCF